METAQEFYELMKQIVDYKYRENLQYKPIPTCDIVEVYDWLEAVAKQLNVKIDE